MDSGTRPASSSFRGAEAGSKAVRDTARHAALRYHPSQARRAQGRTRHTIKANSRPPAGDSLFLRRVLRGTVFALRGTVLRGTCLEGHCQLSSLRTACPGGGRAAARLRAGARLLRQRGERGGRWGGELRAARALEVQPRAGLEAASRPHEARARCRAPRRAYPSAAPMWETRPVWLASQHICQLAEAGRGWPRLAEAGGRPELDLVLAGRAGGRIGRSLWAAVIHMAPHLGLLAAALAAVRLRRLLVEACSPREGDARRAARPAR
eukprot:scaffold33213_cov60-Phaeocystis_antarctica.AAC.6